MTKEMNYKLLLRPKIYALKLSAQQISVFYQHAGSIFKLINACCKVWNGCMFLFGKSKIHLVLLNAVHTPIPCDDTFYK